MKKTLDILLIEDDPADVDLTKEMLEEGKLESDLHVVSDGEKALAYLHRQGPYASAKLPDLILLDLHLPRKTGQEVLQEIKKIEELKSIPVIILTTSDLFEDISDTYKMGAVRYVVKPLRVDEFTRVIKSLEEFWTPKPS